MPDKNVEPRLETLSLPPGKHIDDTLDAFELLFVDSINNSIVTFSKMKAVTIVGAIWKPVDAIEI